MKHFMLFWLLLFSVPTFCLSQNFEEIDEFTSKVLGKHISKFQLLEHIGDNVWMDKLDGTKYSFNKKGFLYRRTETCLYNDERWNVMIAKAVGINKILGAPDEIKNGQNGYTNSVWVGEYSMVIIQFLDENGIQIEFYSYQLAD